MYRTKRDVDKHVSDILNKIKNENERNLRGYTFAKMYYVVRDFESAKRYLAGFLSLKERDAAGHRLMGQIHEQTGHLEKALQSYKRSLELEDNQKEVVLKICELYCQLPVDPERARYWADRAEVLFPNHEVVFKLRETIVNADGEPNSQELEDLIASELAKRPRDAQLRIKLIRLFLDTERVIEAYEHALAVESKRPYADSLDWYYCLTETLEFYAEENGQNLSHDYYYHILNAYDRLVSLCLEERVKHNPLSHINPPASHSGDSAAALQSFDQAMYKASKITESREGWWSSFLTHMRGQLYFHLGTYILKRVKTERRQANMKEAVRLAAALFLAAYTFKPPDFHSAWYVQASDAKRKEFDAIYKESCYRLSQAGHVVIGLCKEDKSKWLQRIRQQVCTTQCREKIFQNYCNGHDTAALSSCFLNDLTLIELTPEFPDIKTLQEYDETAHLLYPESLHYVVWLALQYYTPKQKLQPDYKFKIFDCLPMTYNNLSTATPESLCRLDIDAFVYATVQTTALALEERNAVMHSVQDSPNYLPASISIQMCTNQQAEWWSAAFYLSRNQARDNVGELRRILQHGIEVIRLLGPHGIHVTLAVHLAQTFAERAQQLKEQNNSDVWRHLEIRAAHYWKVAIEMLEKAVNNQPYRMPKDRLFCSSSREPSIDDMKKLIEDGKLYLACQAMNSNKNEEALKMFDQLKMPYASYYQARIYEKLASEEFDQPKELITSEMRSKNIILLTKSRDAYYVTLDRIQGNKNHPLNLILSREIEAIESKLDRIDPDTALRHPFDGLSDECISSPDSEAPDPESPNQYATPSRKLRQTFSSTPHGITPHGITPHGITSHGITPHGITPHGITPHGITPHGITPHGIVLHDSPDQLLSTTRHREEHTRPSPERLDAQVRYLTFSQDTMFKQMFGEQTKLFAEQTKMFTDISGKIVDELKEIKIHLEEIGKQIATTNRLRSLMAPRKNDRAKQTSKDNGTEASENGEDYYDNYYYDDDEVEEPTGPYDYQYNAAYKYPEPLQNEYPYGHVTGLHGTATVTYAPPQGGSCGLQPRTPMYPNYYPNGPPPPMPPPPTPGHVLPPNHVGYFGPGGISTGLPFGEGQKLPEFNFNPSLTTIQTSTVGSTGVENNGKTSVFNRLGPSSQGDVNPNFTTPIQVTTTTVTTTSSDMQHQHPVKITTGTSHTNSQVVTTDSSSNKTTTVQTITSATTETSIDISPTSASSQSSLAPHAFQITMPDTPNAPISSTFQNIISAPSVQTVTDSQRSPSDNKIPVSGDDEQVEESEDADFKPIIPLPDEVEVRTGEEDENVSFEARAKLFRFINKEWKERGIGVLKILYNEKTGRSRILMRRDQVWKICANHIILSDMKLSSRKDNDKTWIWAANDFADEKMIMERFCVKFKTPEIAQNFKEEFEKAQMKKQILTSATQETKSTVGFGDKFKPKAGTWSCEACMVTNESNVGMCVACSTPKTGSSAFESKSVTVPNTNQFSQFQWPSMDKQQTTVGFGDKFKPKTGSWSCESCFVNNNQNAKSCMACTAPKKATNEPNTAIQWTSGANTVIVTTVFGASARQDAPTQTSSVSKLTPSTQTSGFNLTPTIGPVKTWSFGSIPAPTTPSPEKGSPEKGSPVAGFVFGAKSEDVTGGGFVFGASSMQKKDEPISYGGFTFTSSPTIKTVTEKTEETKLASKGPTPKGKEVVTPVKATVSSPKGGLFAQFSFSPPAKLDFTPKPKLSTKPIQPEALTVTSTQTPTTSTNETTDVGLTTVLKTAPATVSSTQQMYFSSMSLNVVKRGFQVDPNFKGFEGSGQSVFQTATKAREVSEKVHEKSEKASEKTESETDVQAEADVQFEPVIPLPDLVEVRTGEEDDDKLFGDRARLYRYDSQSQQWKERGTGEIKILKNRKTGTMRVLMRREQVHKVCANHRIEEFMKIGKLPISERALTWAARDFSDEVERDETFAARFKTQEQADSFDKIFNQCINEAKYSKTKETVTLPSTDDVTNVPLSQLFKPKENCWECTTCMIQNTEQDEKCVACNTNRLSAGADRVTGGTKFALDTPKKTEKSLFTFGLTSTPQSAPVFKFGETAQQESTEFKFGTPQSFTFNFSGVRPKSPSKTPKTPEGESAGEGDDSVDDEGDHIFFSPVIPLPDKIEVKTGEEDEIVLYCQRAKLYRKAGKEWKERGLGDFKILKHKETCKVRFLMRREQIHKVCLNHYLNPALKFIVKDEKSWMWAATDYAENEPAEEVFVLRFKNTDIANEFMKAVDNAKSSTSTPPTPTIRSTTSTPSSSFSFKMDDISSPSPAFSFGSKFGVSSSPTSSIFGGSSLSPKSLVFGGSAVTSPNSFSIGDTSFAKIAVKKGNISLSKLIDVTDSKTKDDGENDLTVVWEKIPTIEQRKKALMLMLPPTFYLYEDLPPCPGCRGCENDEEDGKQAQSVSKNDDIQIVKETKAEPDQVKQAQDLNLPPNFFLYENKEPCPGCRGCDEPAEPTSVVQDKPMAPSVDILSLFPTSGPDFAELAKSNSGVTAFSGRASVGFKIPEKIVPVFGSSNANDDAEDEESSPKQPDIHFEPVVPLPELVDVVTGEEEEDITYCQRAKLYRFDADKKEWKERGVGDAKILKHKQTNRYRLLLRRDQIFKIACNHYITTEMSLQPLTLTEAAWCWYAMDFADEKPKVERLAIRFKTIELAKEFKRVFEECQEDLKRSSQPISGPVTELSACDTSQSSMSDNDSSRNDVSDKTQDETVVPKYPDDHEGDGEPEEDDDDGDSVMFEKRVNLSCSETRGGPLKPKGMGVLRVLYDDDFYGARIQVVTDDNQLVCNHLISMQNTVKLEGRVCVWTAEDFSMEQATQRQFQATFSTPDAAKEFESTFAEGWDYAKQSGIWEHHPFNPAGGDNVSDNGTATTAVSPSDEVKACSPELAAVLAEIIRGWQFEWDNFGQWESEEEWTTYRKIRRKTVKTVGQQHTTNFDSVKKTTTDKCITEFLSNSSSQQEMQRMTSVFCYAMEQLYTNCPSVNPVNEERNPMAIYEGNDTNPERLVVIIPRPNNLTNVRIPVVRGDHDNCSDMFLTLSSTPTCVSTPMACCAERSANACCGDCKQVPIYGCPITSPVMRSHSPDSLEYRSIRSSGSTIYVDAIEDDLPHSGNSPVKTFCTLINESDTETHNSSEYFFDPVETRSEKCMSWLHDIPRCNCQCNCHCHEPERQPKPPCQDSDGPSICGCLNCRTPVQATKPHENDRTRAAVLNRPEAIATPVTCRPVTTNTSRFNTELVTISSAHGSYSPAPMCLDDPTSWLCADLEGGARAMDLSDPHPSTEEKIKENLRNVARSFNNRFSSPDKKRSSNSMNYMKATARPRVCTTVRGSPRSGKGYSNDRNMPSSPRSLPTSPCGGARPKTRISRLNLENGAEIDNLSDMPTRRTPRGHRVREYSSEESINNNDNPPMIIVKGPSDDDFLVMHCRRCRQALGDLSTRISARKKVDQSTCVSPKDIRQSAGGCSPLMRSAQPVCMPQYRSRIHHAPSTGSGMFATHEQPLVVKFLEDPGTAPITLELLDDQCRGMCSSATSPPLVMRITPNRPINRNYLDSAVQCDGEIYLDPFDSDVGVTCILSEPSMIDLSCQTESGQCTNCNHRSSQHAMGDGCQCRRRSRHRTGFHRQSPYIQNLGPSLDNPSATRLAINFPSTVNCEQPPCHHQHMVGANHHCNNSKTRIAHLPPPCCQNSYSGSRNSQQPQNQCSSHTSSCQQSASQQVSPCHSQVQVPSCSSSQNSVDCMKPIVKTTSAQTLLCCQNTSVQVDLSNLNSCERGCSPVEFEDKEKEVCDANSGMFIVNRPTPGTPVEVPSCESVGDSLASSVDLQFKMEPQFESNMGACALRTDVGKGGMWDLGNAKNATEICAVCTNHEPEPSPSSWSLSRMVKSAVAKIMPSFTPSPSPEARYCDSDGSSSVKNYQNMLHEQVPCVEENVDTKEKCIVSSCDQRIRPYRRGSSLSSTEYITVSEQESEPSVCCENNDFLKFLIELYHNIPDESKPTCLTELRGGEDNSPSDTSPAQGNLEQTSRLKKLCRQYYIASRDGMSNYTGRYTLTRLGSDESCSSSGDCNCRVNQVRNCNISSNRTLTPNPSCHHQRYRTPLTPRISASWGGLDSILDNISSTSTDQDIKPTYSYNGYNMEESDCRCHSEADTGYGSVFPLTSPSHENFEKKKIKSKVERAKCRYGIVDSPTNSCSS